MSHLKKYLNVILGDEMIDMIYSVDRLTGIVWLKPLDFLFDFILFKI